MNMRERFRPKRTKLMLLIALIYLLSLSGIIAKQPAEASERDTIFTDIQPGSEYEEALDSLMQQEIIFGYSDGTFRPSEKLNREQAAVILARALQLNLEAVDDPNFQDVNESSNYYKSIAAVVNAGIFQGYADGTFKPNQSLTRAEMAKILVVAYQLPEEELVINPFKDVSSTSWYAPYLTSLIQNKITIGTSLTTYSPNVAVNRGEMALFIYRCQQLTERIIESEVTTITSDFVQLGNESFALTDDQKTWITPENLPILKNSRIKAHIIGDKISRIESVTLYADGQLNYEMENPNIVLTGNGAVIDATVIIKGDNLSIKDATITRDLIIESDVQNSFYLEKVLVKGSTILSKPRRIVTAETYNSFFSLDIKNSHNPKLHIHNSILQSVKSSLKSFTIKLTGDTKVNEIDLLVDARIEAEASITIPIVRVGPDSLNTVLHAVIDSLFIENNNSRITLGNNAEIEDLRLERKNDVKLIFPDYELIKHKIIRINGLPNIDMQPPAVGGGSPVTGENSKLMAAKNAVAALFTDSSKTALKVGVDQAAIDAANAKVALVADSAEKSALVADLQFAQQLLDAQLEAIANLQAATEAVNGLFTDSTKTALKAGVDQAAIDAANAKVALVADSAEKSALIADLQFAQQLLDTQLEAIANLQAATEAVNGLFTDSTKTALKAGVDQAAIDAAKAKVDLVADGTEKSALEQAIAIAQGLLNQPLDAPTLTGTAPNVDTVQITFADDAAWRDKITGVYLNGNLTPIHSSRVNRSTEGIIEINLTGASLSPGTHQFLIKAEGYADAIITIEVEPPLAAPTLTGTAPNVDTVRITFTDDAAWRDKITGVYLNGNLTPIHSSRVNSSIAGIIEINLTNASLNPGTHQFLIKAEGYADAIITIEVEPPLEAPTLTGTAPNVDTVWITFTDDAVWRDKITGVYLNGNWVPIHSSRVNSSTAGIIEINFTNASLNPGTHEFLIKADGYADALVTIEVEPPLAAPTLMGTAPNVDTVWITFTDDAVWRDKITGVYLNGNLTPIHSSRVNSSIAGIIEINLTNASLNPGTHQFLIKAEGYEDAMVMIIIEP